MYNKYKIKFLANTNLILEHYYMPVDEEVEHILKRPPTYMHLRLWDSPLGKVFLISDIQVSIT